MKSMTFKVVSFLASFLFLQGAVLPWVISNNYLPLWVDIILLSAILVGWLFVMDRVAYYVLEFVKKNNELPN